MYMFLILTNASIGAPELYSKKDINLIRAESKKANKLIGTKNLIFEDLPALNLQKYPMYKIANIINKHLEKIKPEIILLAARLVF